MRLRILQCWDPGNGRCFIKLLWYKSLCVDVCLINSSTKTNQTVLLLQAAGGRKRKAASSDDDNDAAAAGPAMPSKKRLCFQKQVKPAVSAERDDSSNEELSDSDVDNSMDIDSMAESLAGIDSEMGSAVAGLLSMRRSSSADMHNFGL